MRGFPSRVVHGALLISYISRLVGVHCPGENALIQSLNAQFHAPCFIGDAIEISGKVCQISTAVNTVVLEVLITNVHTGSILVKSKVQVGFLKSG